MGHCSSKQHQIASSQQGITIRLSFPSSNRRRSTKRTIVKTKLFTQTSKRVTAEMVRSSIGRAIHQRPRLITCDEDSQSVDRSRSRSSLIQSSAINSTDGQNSVAVVSLSLHTQFRNNTNSSHNQQQQQQNKNNQITQTYNILPQITGRGVAGQVRQCVHRPTSQLCAVKTITKSRTRRKDRIEREISFLEKVDHPNIMKLYDAYEDEDEVHIVTELCHGGELFDKIVEKVASNKNRSRKNRIHVPANPTCFCEKDAARIIHSLLSAVAYLHYNDIIHRDIKPENILFANEGNEESSIKLIDFGLSIRHTRNCSPLTNTVGTAYYMAPEVLHGSYDRSCDLWSIGVIAYVLLSGRPPFNGDSQTIFAKIKAGQYKMENSRLWDDGVSMYAKDFIRCLLDMDPRKRWSADMALQHAWLKF